MKPQIDLRHIIIPIIIIMVLVFASSFSVFANGDKNEKKDSGSGSKTENVSKEESEKAVEDFDGIEDYLLHPEISLEQQYVTIKVYNSDFEIISESRIDKGQEIQDEELKSLLRQSDLLMKDENTYFYVANR